MNIDECDFKVNQNQEFITLKHYKSEPDALAVKETVIVSSASLGGSLLVLISSRLSSIVTSNIVRRVVMLPFS